MGGLVSSEDYETLSSIPGDVALFATSPSWLDSPFVISEDFNYVMGGGNYFPIPFFDFKSSFRKLASKSIIFHPSKLTERIDYNPSNSDDSNFIYFLSNNVLSRLRKDSLEKNRNKNALHTVKMIGEKRDICSLCELISLPNPFEKEKFPYRNLFIDENTHPLSVLR